jgi:hypothetical protein
MSKADVLLASFRLHSGIAELGMGFWASVSAFVDQYRQRNIVCEWNRLTASGFGRGSRMPSVEPTKLKRS